MEKLEKSESKLIEAKNETLNLSSEQISLSLVSLINEMEGLRDKFPGKLSKMNDLLADCNSPIDSALDYSLILKKLNEYLDIFEWIENLNEKIISLMRDKYYLSVYSSSYSIEDKLNEAKNIINIERELELNKLKDYEKENPNWTQIKKDFDMILITNIERLNKRIKVESGPMGILKLIPGKNKKIEMRNELKEFYQKLKQENNNINIQKPDSVIKFESLCQEFLKIEGENNDDYYNNLSEVRGLLIKESNLIKSNNQNQNNFSYEISVIKNKLARFNFIQEELNESSPIIIEYLDLITVETKKENNFINELYKDKKPVTEVVFLEKKNIDYDLANKIKLEKLFNLSNLDIKNLSEREIRQWTNEVENIISGLSSAYIYCGFDLDKENKIAETVESSLFFSDDMSIKKLNEIKENLKSQLLEVSDKISKYENLSEYIVQLNGLIKLSENVPVNNAKVLHQWLQKPIKKFCGNLFTHVSGEKAIESILSNGALLSREFLGETKTGMNNNHEENKIFFDTNNISAVYGAGRNFDTFLKRFWFCLTGQDVIEADLTAQYRLFFGIYKFIEQHDPDGEPLISINHEKLGGTKIPLENITLLYPDNMNKKFLEIINSHISEIKTVGTFNNKFYESKDSINKKEMIKIDEIRRISELIRKDKEKKLPNIAISAIPIESKKNNRVTVNYENVLNSKIEPFSFVTFVKLKNINSQ